MPGGVAARIVGYTAGNSILINDTTVDTAAFTPSGPDAGTLTIGNNGSAAYALDLTSDYAGASFITAPSFSGGAVLMSVECFASGTRLATTGGDVAVEDLSISDFVRARTLGIRRSRGSDGGGSIAAGIPSDRGSGRSACEPARSATPCRIATCCCRRTTPYWSRAC